MITYEVQLGRDFDWALREGSTHFDEQNAVHKTLRKFTERLKELGIDYAVADAMAMFFHGHRRFTEDVDVLVTRESLERIHNELSGRGYLPPFKKSKNLRDTESGVRIDFIITGGYPGDGKPGPIAFPDPADVSCEIDGMSFVELPKLVELKLASGQSPARHKDIGDAQEMIRVLKLPKEFAEQLHPSLRDAYLELWQALADSRAEEF